MTDWQVGNLGSIAAEHAGSIAIGPFGSTMKADVYSSTGVPIIRGTNISETRRWKGDWVYIPEAFADAMPRCVVRAGALVFPHRGSIGEVAIVPHDGYSRYFLSSSIMKIDIDPRKADPDFVYFYFRSALGRAEILRYSSQVGTPGIGQPLQSLRQFRLPLPPITSQRAIASVLGSLDRKIDLNHRMNETLEATARAIFKDWFFDFGPTRAKMEGRAPYFSPDIWALFPDRLDHDGKPEGWRRGTLGDVAVQCGEGARPDTLAAETPYIGLEHMPRRSIALNAWEGAGKVTSGKLSFKRGDFLFGKLRPYFHKIGIAPLDGICSTDIVVLKEKRPSARSFVITCISEDEFVAYTDRTSDGTKMPRTSWGRMEKYPVVIPGSGALTAFEATTISLFDRLLANIHENRTLAATRDLLLSKLMSGEVRVKDAEKLAGRAA